jgi:hypothetical protein
MINLQNNSLKKSLYNRSLAVNLSLFWLTNNLDVFSTLARVVITI